MDINKTVSKAGFEKLKQEREYLVTVRRKEVSEKLKEARSFGDLSENAEYDEAKNEQAILESRINELELLISNATVVEDEDISVNEVGIGSIVKLKDLEFDEIEEEEQKKKVEFEVKKENKIIITCKTKRQTEDLYKRLIEEGYSCTKRISE